MESKSNHIFHINASTIFSIDEYFDAYNLRHLEGEIDAIVKSIWMTSDELGAILAPAFSIFLETNILRKFYITYFSLSNILTQYDHLHITASTKVLDIALQALDIPCSDKCVSLVRRTIRDECKDFEFKIYGNNLKDNDQPRQNAATMEHLRTGFR